MTDILNRFQTLQPREVSGGWTSDRYEYQRNFSVLLILDLQNAGADYRIVLDYFDDIAVLDNSELPTGVTFFQVKTKEDGLWKISDFVTLSKGPKPRSVVGKMYENLLNFSPRVRGLVFVSNQGYSFMLSDGRRSGIHDLIIACKDLSPVESNRLTTALDADFLPPPRPDYKPLLSFRRSELGLLGQQDFVLGRLMRFFKEQGAAEHVPVSQVYEALHTEVARKSGIFKGFGSMEDFYSEKTIAREQVALLFARATGAKLVDQFWANINTELVEHEFTPITCIRIKKATFLYVADRAAGKLEATRFSLMAASLIAANRDALDVEESIVGRAILLAPQCAGYSDCPYSGTMLTAALIVHVLEDELNDVEHHRAATFA